MAKSKTDAQTANEEQVRVAGVLNGDSNVYAESVDEGVPEECSQGGYVGAGSARPRGDNGDKY